MSKPDPHNKSYNLISTRNEKTLTPKILTFS